MKKLLVLSWVLLLIGIVCIFVDAPRAQVNLPLLGVGGNAGGCSAAFTAGPLSQGGAGTLTFSAQNIGSASASRRVVVGVQAVMGTNGATISATINGSSATSAVSDTSDLNQRAQIFYLAVSSGTTADIAITASSGSFNAGQIAVYATTNCNTNPSGGSTVGTTAWGVINPGNMVVTATVPTGGIGVGVFGTDRALTPTFSVGTLDFHQNSGSDDIFGVHIAAAGSQTLTSSSVVTSYDAVMATWGP